VKGRFRKKKQGGNQNKSLSHLPNGDCCFLAEDRLCSLQTRFGLDVLPTICQTFPRRYIEIQGRTELSGRWSCPESVRRALETDDSLSAVAGGRDLLESGGRIVHRVESKANDGYHAVFDLVQQMASVFFCGGSWPLTSRLFFLGSLAYELEPAFHRGVSLDAVGDVSSKISRLCTPGTLDDLHERIDNAQVPIETTLKVVVHCLVSMWRHTPLSNLRGLVNEVFANLTGGNSSMPDISDPEKTNLCVEDLIAGYRQASGRLRQVSPERLERHLQIFARHFWQDGLYVVSSSLLDHMRLLLVRLAAMQLLILGQTQVCEALTACANAPEGQKSGLARVLDEAIDRAAVRGISAFERSFDHSAGGHQFIEKTWDQVSASEWLFCLIKTLNC